MITSPRQIYTRHSCGCMVTRRFAGDGWYFYEIHACPQHPWMATAFWMPPCECALSTDGHRALCEPHQYLAPFQRTAGGVH